MRVAILANDQFLDRERTKLSRLEIGLAAEGVRVAHALPEHVLGDEAAGVYSTVVPYSARGFRFTRPERVAELATSLGGLLSCDPTDCVDVVHCFGGSTWAMGAELARQSKACVLLEIWRTALIRRVPRVMRDPTLPGRIAVVAPDLAVRRALTRVVPSGEVYVAPWGVHAAEKPTALFEEGRSLAITILASGHDARGLAACLEGVQSALEMRPDTMVFLDAEAARRAHAWKKIRALGMTDRVTLVPHLEGRREPVLQTDILLQPEAYGEHRSLTLDAMAAGMVVIARRDAMIEYLVGGRTAHLVNGVSSGVWAEALGWALSRPEEARALAASARQYVAEHRPASGYIGGVMNAYLALVESTRAAAAAAG